MLARRATVRGVVGVRHATTDGRTTVGNVSQYSSSTFTSGRTQTRVVCKQKPIVRSRLEALWVYLKPTNHPEYEWMDPVQIGKFLGYLMVPVVSLVWWKNKYQSYPDKWEQQFQGLQNRPNKTENVEAKQESYTDVMTRLEGRRDSAMRRLGHE